MKRFLNSNRGQKLGFLITLLIVWEGLSLAGAISPLFFPSLSATLTAVIKGLTSENLLMMTMYSIWIILKGMFFGGLLAIILSTFAILSRVGNNIVQTLITIFHPLPGLALLPVAMLWFGIGESSMLVIIIHSILWPVVQNLIYGFKAVPRSYIEVGQNLGLTGWNMVWLVMIPASLSYIISGLKTGWARGWRAAIAAEMVFGAAGKAAGLGWYIYMKRFAFDIAGTFAGLLIIVLVGIVVEEVLFQYLEKATVQKWGMSQ